jgi:phosphoglycolate phosphatase/beta-phosphoglucomutase
MPAVLRALLFDFNGVLVDDEPLHLELFQRVAAEEGLAPPTEEDYYARYLGFDDRAAFAAMLAAAGRPAEPPRVARLVARKAAYYQELIHRRGYPFFPGARELARAAAGGGLRLGVVSGALREEVAGALAQAGIAELIPILVTAEDVAESKPHPEGYLLALELLNSVPPLPERLIHPHEVLAIEDSPAGLESAAAAGLLTLAVAHTYARGRLRADAVVDSLEGLTVAAIERRLT